MKNYLSERFSILQFGLFRSGGRSINVYRSLSSTSCIFVVRVIFFWISNQLYLVTDRSLHFLSLIRIATIRPFKFWREKKLNGHFSKMRHPAFEGLQIE